MEDDLVMDLGEDDHIGPDAVQHVRQPYSPLSPNPGLFKLEEDTD